MSTEPFPQLLTRELTTDSRVNGSPAKPVRASVRRKSSGLGGEIRAGDTGAPALTTLDVRPPLPSNAKAQIEKEAQKGKRGYRRRKVRTLVQRAKRYAVRHSWFGPAILLSIFGFLYALNPTSSNPVHRFIFLSYRIPHPLGTPEGTPHQYGKGRWDVAFVSFYTIVLSFTREFIMQNLLRPLAARSGLKSRAKQARFMEQMYTAIYFGCLGPAGMYVMSRTPVWYFNTYGMYDGFPHKTHEGLLKFYYLFQGAYWAQQAIVLMLGMEKPRKDFKELVGHHIVSLSLIALSYRFHFVYMGLAVYITHDISDFFLATSKVLNYLDSPIVGPYFALFIGVWIYLRHYLNLRILYSGFTEFKTVGPYELDWAAEQYKCWLSHYISTALLGALQCLNLFWLFYILRIAYRFAWQNVAKDDRSDDDEVEFLEEQKEDELRNRIAEPVIAPKVTLNGEPVSPIDASGASSGLDLKRRKLMNRSS